MNIAVILLIANLMVNNKLDTVVIVEPDEITSEILENREDNYLLVEMVVGTVLDDEGNGKVLNTTDDYYNYIAYHKLDCEEGDVVLTYLFFDNTDGEDDFIERYDFIIEEGK